MPRLFPRWSDTALRLALLALVGGVTLVLAVPMLYVRSPYGTGAEIPVDQPVQFDHRHHVRDDGIDCRFCHDHVERSSFAGVPPTERCAGCHSQVWPESPMLEPVRRSFFSGVPLPWNRVHQLPGFVYFDHSIHVAKGVGCSECHGRVDGMALVYQKERLTMEWCLDCHRDPAMHLRPRELVTSMGYEHPANQREVGERLRRQYGVRSLTTCTTCHR